MMEAESGGGWGMSIASQRAKERENRTPDVEVTLKMVKFRMLKLAWAVVPLGWAVVLLAELSGGTARGGGCTAHVGIRHSMKRGAILWRKWMISGQNWVDFVDGKRGNSGEC